MKPMFLYLGAKHKLARDLGRPRYPHVIEPFAGSLGYSCYWEPPQVTAIERDPIIAGIWRYLIRVSPDEIMRLPSRIDNVAEISGNTCEEARHLIGMWLNRATAQPVKRRSAWAKRPAYAPYFWGEQIKLRLATQVPKIKHWRLIEGDWWEIANTEAHWHFDPPYIKAGKHYKYNKIDRAALAEWCRTRAGFVQICEASSATWLPFESYAEVTTHHNSQRTSREAVYEVENEAI